MPARLQLEDAERLAAAQHLVRLRVAVRQRLQVDRRRRASARSARPPRPRIVRFDEAEEVHLQQADLGDRVHRELRRRQRLARRRAAGAAAARCSTSGSRAITTPAACVLAWRATPSSLRAVSTSFAHLRVGLVRAAQLRRSPRAPARSSCAARWAPAARRGRRRRSAMPRARPTSRIAALAPSVPKVMICATRSCAVALGDVADHLVAAVVGECPCRRRASRGARG